MTDPELSEALRELRGAHEIPPVAYAAVRARVAAGIAAQPRHVWPWWIAAAAAATACIAWMLFLRSAQPPAPPLSRVASSRPVVIAMPAEPAPPAHPVRVHRKRPRPIPRPAEPLQIKMLTDDPDVVIYWIVDTKGD